MTTPLPSVLFVDDEPFILDGLRRMLRPLRHDWDLQFAPGGPEALALMANQPFAVVISDMRMPGMNGAQLLQEVQKRHPLTIRVILSGHADQELVTQCVGVAHQYLAKPCDAETLKATLDTLRAMAGPEVTPEVRRLVGTLERLPALPGLYRDLQAALRREDTGPAEVGAIIQQDPAMTAQILKLVNSAFFGLRRSIGTAQEAASYLGLDTIRTLVLAHGVFGAQAPFACRSLSLEDLWTHSLAVATHAATLAKTEGKPRAFQDTCFAGGILHDLGLLVFANGMPERCDELARRVQAEGLQLADLEGEVFGCTHGEVGAYLLGLWGLPPALVAILREHHGQGLSSGCPFTPSVAVWAADVIAGHSGIHPLFETEDADFTTLAGLGFAERLPAWREACLGQEARP
jgi:putative nucleotidyltransferase with HDIG domain